MGPGRWHHAFLLTVRLSELFDKGRARKAVLLGLIGTGAHHLLCNDNRVLVTIVVHTVHELHKTVDDKF
jgi:hypothetical protein